jgi:hypothetical protein
VILVAPAIAVGLEAHAAAWCLRLGHTQQARALGAAAGLLASLWTLVRLIYEGVLAPKAAEDPKRDAVRAVGEHVVALAHQSAMRAQTDADGAGPPINARKPPGAH